MPARRTVTIKIQPKVLDALLNSGFRLCFGFAINGVFNVAASTMNITPEVTISWTETYSIAATVQTFRSGSVVMSGQSARLPIDFKQKYSLPSWKTSSVGSEPSLPEGSFALYNGVDAAGVVYMDTGDAQPVAIYIDTINPPKVTTIFTPVSKIMLWFDRSIQTSTMIVSSKIDNPHVIDMTGTTLVSTTYQDSGEWMDG